MLHWKRKTSSGCMAAVARPQPHGYVAALEFQMQIAAPGVFSCRDIFRSWYSN